MGVKGSRSLNRTHNCSQAFQGDPYRPCLVLRPEVARQGKQEMGGDEGMQKLTMFDDVLWTLTQMVAKATRSTLVLLRTLEFGISAMENIVQPFLNGSVDVGVLSPLQVGDPFVAQLSGRCMAKPHAGGRC